MTIRVVIGADSAGVGLKALLCSDLEADDRVGSTVDIGLNGDEDVDYPHIAFSAAKMVASGEADRAVLVCGTGLGMAIAANKVAGVRAVTAHDSYSVERSVLSNNAQILCLGARVIGPELARRLVQEWLGYCFDDHSRSAAKVELINDYESRLASVPSGQRSYEQREATAHASQC